MKLKNALLLALGAAVCASAFTVFFICSKVITITKRAGL